MTGTSPGDEVRVWFEAGGKRSQSFTYAGALGQRAPVLIMAAEDYSGKPGAGPRTPTARSRTTSKYYTDALTANGIAYDVYDVDARAARRPTRSAC